MTVTPTSGATAAAPVALRPNAKKTIMMGGEAAVVFADAHAAPAPIPANAAMPTMLGMPASDLENDLACVEPAGIAPGAFAPAMAEPQAQVPAAARPFNVQKKTMLGVALPGIAPLQDNGVPSAHAKHPTDVGGLGPASPDLRSKQTTMLGIALPGTAATHGVHSPSPPGHPVSPRVPSQLQNTVLGIMAPLEVSVVPRPRTLIEEALPRPPAIPTRKGVPALAVLGIVSGVVVVLGASGVYLATRGGGSLTAVPLLDESGRESLKMGCPTCPDGTSLVLGASSAAVTASAAVLPLPAPLSIGDNDLTVRIDRPGAGRDEEVKVHVPVAYRVRADLSTLSAKPPAITVRIEATPGSTVSVEEKPVTLDATGRGSYVIDLSRETEGTGEAKTFERKIPFAITPSSGKPEAGQLTARTSVVPLALDAPGRELITDKVSAAVAGQTRAGSAITIDGQSVRVDAQGKFGVRVALSENSEKRLEIVASAPPLAPRIVNVKVMRVPALEAASKGEDAQNPIGFDAFGADPAAKTGQRAVVEGQVVEARVTAGHTVLIIDDTTKCAKGASCLVRVLHGDEDTVVRGDTVRAYGRLLGGVAANGKVMPDIEASLVLSLKTRAK